MLSKNKISFIILIIGFAIILFWQFIGKGMPVVEKSVPEGTLRTVGDGTDLDSDDDGSPDWEELLWGFDPTDPDTGNEGMLDGAKIKEKKALAIKSIGTKPVGTPPEESTGEQFGQDLYSSLLLLQQSGQLTPENIQSLVERAGGSLLEYGNSYINESIFLKENIIQNEDTDQNIEKYITEMQAAHQKYPMLGSDFENFRKFMETGEKAENFQEEMSGIYQKYLNLIEEMKQIETPASFVEIQYGLINNLSVLSNIFKNLSIENPDQTKILIDSIMYVPTLNNLQSLYLKIDYFMKVFSKNA